LLRSVHEYAKEQRLSITEDALQKTVEFLNSPLSNPTLGGKLDTKDEGSGSQIIGDPEEFNDVDVSESSSKWENSMSLESNTGETLENNESGINLGDEPLELGGSDIDELELPEDGMIILEDADDPEPATIMQSDEFNLSSLEPVDEDVAGNQVIALQDSEIYAQLSFAETAIALGITEGELEKRCNNGEINEEGDALTWQGAVFLRMEVERFKKVLENEPTGSQVIALEDSEGHEDDRATILGDDDWELPQGAIDYTGGNRLQEHGIIERSGVHLIRTMTHWNEFFNRIAEHELTIEHVNGLLINNAEISKFISVLADASKTGADSDYRWDPPTWDNDADNSSSNDQADEHKADATEILQPDTMQFNAVLDELGLNRAELIARCNNEDIDECNPTDNWDDSVFETTEVERLRRILKEEAKAEHRDRNADSANNELDSDDEKSDISENGSFKGDPPQGDIEAEPLNLTLFNNDDQQKTEVAEMPKLTSFADVMERLNIKEALLVRWCADERFTEWNDEWNSWTEAAFTDEQIELIKQKQRGAKQQKANVSSKTKTTNNSGSIGVSSNDLMAAKPVVNQSIYDQPIELTPEPEVSNPESIAASKLIDKLEISKDELYERLQKGHITEEELPRTLKKKIIFRVIGRRPI